MLKGGVTLGEYPAQITEWALKKVTEGVGATAWSPVMRYINSHRIGGSL